MTRYCIGLILILTPYIITAQVLLDTTTKREIYLDHLGIEDGLSQGMVYDLAIDQEGHMWIATKEGLNRYDGKKFKIYRHDSKDPLSISDNLVTKLFVDSRNNLWIGTDLNGLNLFNRETESFKHFSTNSANQHKLSSNSIGRIFEDPKGNIIIQTKSGNGYDILIPDSSDNLPDYNIYLIQEIYPSLKKIMDENCCSRHLFFKANGSIWYYGSDSIYSIKDPALENSPYQSYSTRFPNNKVYFGNQFVFDPQTEAAYIISNTMIERYDSVANQFLPYVKMPNNILINKDIFIDKKSRLWFTFQNNKWWNIDLKNKKLNTVVAKAEGFNDRGFCCTFFKYHDQQDNLWIGTGGFGLLKWSGIAQKFFYKIRQSKIFNFGLLELLNPVKKLILILKHQING